MSDLKKYLSEAISRGRTITRYSAIQDLDFGMEIIEFWDKLVEIGVPDSIEDAKIAKVRKDILDHKGILVRKYLTTIYLFVGSSDHYYFISNDLGHDPREVGYISRNDKGAFPKEIGEQALDSLKKDLEDLSKSGEINEAVSSGRNRTRNLDYPKERTGKKAMQDIIDFLESKGFKRYTGSLRHGISNLFNICKDRKDKLYAYADGWGTAVCFATPDSNVVYDIDTDQKKKESVDVMDPNGPLLRRMLGKDGVYIMGFRSLESFWEDVEKEFGW